MERVSIITGQKPILLIAPHGYALDDQNTAYITENIAKKLDCYAVINRGWERDKTVNIWKDKADCNNILHCHEDVVKEEFLDPILKFSKILKKKYKKIFVYLIHGMAEKHAEKHLMQIVIGYGAGNPDSFSCDPWRKDAFIYLLNSEGLEVYEGKKGGTMSGWSRQNLNQLFRKWYTEPAVQSMQIEIIHSLRVKYPDLIVENLSSVMNDMLLNKQFSVSKNIKEY